MIYSVAFTIKQPKKFKVVEVAAASKQEALKFVAASENARACRIIEVTEMETV